MDCSACGVDTRNGTLWIYFQQIAKRTSGLDGEEDGTGTLRGCAAARLALVPLSREMERELETR